MIASALYVRRIIFIFLFTLAHFGLTMLTMCKGFIIFRSPTTASEIFSVGAMAVLLFPSDLLYGIVLDTWGQSILIFLNDLLWGIVFTFLFLRWQKFSTRQARAGIIDLRGLVPYDIRRS
jgi:hypothetical protein